MFLKYNILLYPIIISSPTLHLSPKVNKLVSPRVIFWKPQMTFSLHLSPPNSVKWNVYVAVLRWEAAGPRAQAHSQKNIVLINNALKLRGTAVKDLVKLNLLNKCCIQYKFRGIDKRDLITTSDPMFDMLYVAYNIFNFLLFSQIHDGNSGHEGCEMSLISLIG